LSSSLVAETVLPESLDSAFSLYQRAGGYGCHVCHGLDVSGFNLAGSDIRGTSVADYLLALNGDGPMQALQGALTAEEIQEVMSYPAWLGQVELQQITVDSGLVQRFEPGSENVQMGRLFSVYNLGFSTESLGEEDGLPKSVTLEALENRLIWIAATAE
jgi:hypothetical protein